MKTKTILLTLCLGLVVLGGCGRSKPQTAKTAEVASPVVENTPPPPPDQLPPKPAPAAPGTQPPADVAQARLNAGASVQFGPLPAGVNAPGGLTRQQQIDKMWQRHEPGKKVRKAQQNPPQPPQNDGEQSQ